MLLALSNVTYVLIGWFKFLLLKFLYEYGPWWCYNFVSNPTEVPSCQNDIIIYLKWLKMCNLDLSLFVSPNTVKLLYILKCMRSPEISIIHHYWYYKIQECLAWYNFQENVIIWCVQTLIYACYVYIIRWLRIFIISLV